MHLLRRAGLREPLGGPALALEEHSLDHQSCPRSGDIVQACPALGQGGHSSEPLLGRLKHSSRGTALSLENCLSGAMAGERAGTIVSTSTINSFRPQHNPTR